MCPFEPNHESCVIKKGFYPRSKGRAERVQRFLCRNCGRFFSDQTGTTTYRERKPHLNQILFRLLAGGMSQREAAYMLDIHRRTVARKLVRFAQAARLLNYEKNHDAEKANHVQFDEMETFEHTKMKPLSIGLAVTRERRIIAAKVAQMPAKGLLAERSRKKYGPRADHRPKMLRDVLNRVASVADQNVHIRSDMNPSYRRYVREALPGAHYEQFKGIRGCVVGQGELKATSHDPLFSLNHTCAMYRDRVKRLSRRTWCTTKLPERLQDFVDIYAYSHNQRLEQPKVRAKIANIRCR